MAVGMLAALFSLIGGLLVLSRPRAGAIVLLIAFLLMGLSALTLSPLSVVNTLLLLLAMIFGTMAKAPEKAGVEP